MNAYSAVLPHGAVDTVTHLYCVSEQDELISLSLHFKNICIDSWCVKLPKLVLGAKLDLVLHHDRAAI